MPDSKRIFRYGDGVFVTFAVQDGVPLDVDLQVDRILAAAEAIGLERPAGFDTAGAAALTIEELASDLCPAVGRSILRLQWHAVGDSRGFGRVSNASEVMAEVMPAPDPRRPSIVTLGDGAVPLPALPRHKTCSALANVLCAQEARRLGVDEAVRVDSGVLLEASSSNVFWLSGDQLCTPSAALPLYAGTVRHRVIECAPAAGFEVREGEFPPEVMADAEAVLLVNTARGVECASELDGRSLGPVPAGIARLAASVEVRRREVNAGS